jgi:transglutaminase-like putative cysteine protease
MMRRRLPAIFLGLALIPLALGAGEALEQHRQDEYVRDVTREALGGVAAGNYTAKVSALRDYIRAHVRNIDFNTRQRPFLRYSAAETLRMGKGRCGEATRVFINMAHAAGIPAQRLYLEGARSHVVAVVADDNDGSKLLVDAADRPYFPELEPLAGLTRHEEFSTYSTLGWRRLGPLRALPSNYLNLGPLGYLLESPHALVACLWLLLSAATLTLAALLRRRLPRRQPRPSQKDFSVPAALQGGSAGA